ncbi:MAG TPA: rod shape-determining protein MreC [Candidatus Omnitrophota bacterium]|nr:rod shape-determining protein MreC [Candidatus Omnitrophota bacterium]
MRRWRSYYFFAVPLILLILAFQYPHLNETAHAVFNTLTRPFFVMTGSVRQGLLNIRYNAGNFFGAVAKQEEYLRRIEELEARELHAQELEKENKRLMKLLSFSQTLPLKSIGARVIGQDVTPWKKIVELDKGSRHGIHRDMVLVSPEGLVGRILEVEIFTSRAILLPDPDSRVSALTSTSRAQGIITGVGTEKLQMKYLALDAEIAIGEVVLTSGISSIFPKGIEIGKIESIEKDSDGLHLLAVVKPSVSFTKLEEVLCLVSSQPK